MNNKDLKNEKSGFVLNDIIKRKILDMYKISKPSESSNTKDTEENKKPKQ